MAAQSAGFATITAIGIMCYMFAVFIFSYFYGHVLFDLGIAGAPNLSGLSQQQNQFLFSQGFCSAPRNGLDTSIFAPYSLECVSLPAQTAVSCNAIPSCQFINVTSGWFWAPTVNSVCVGQLPVSYYMNGSAYLYKYLPRQNVVIAFNASHLGNTTSFAGVTELTTTEGNAGSGISPTVCDFPLAQTQSVCAQLGCTWVDATRYSSASFTNDQSGVANALTFMFTFNVYTGTPTAFDWIFHIIFVYIPLVALVISLAILIRGLLPIP